MKLAQNVFIILRLFRRIPRLLSLNHCFLKNKRISFSGRPRGTARFASRGTFPKDRRPRFFFISPRLIHVNDIREIVTPALHGLFRPSGFISFPSFTRYLLWVFLMLCYILKIRPRPIFIPWKPVLFLRALPLSPLPYPNSQVEDLRRQVNKSANSLLGLMNVQVWCITLRHRFSEAAVIPIFPDHSTTLRRKNARTTPLLRT